MKLFTVGPVEMFERTLEVKARQVPYFRNSLFSDVVLDCEARFRKLLRCTDLHKLILLTASGTGAMEASVLNGLTAEDRVLVIDGGTWGHRFASICEVHAIPIERVPLELGEALTEEKLVPYEGRGFTALLVNLHETSTGQLYDLDMLSSFCERNGLLFFVDAISAFLADPIDLSRSKVDALILSSHKGLALSPGLSFVILSPRILRERIPRIRPRSFYFDFAAYIDNGRRGQTPFTPAVGIVLELQDMLRAVEEVGIDDWVATTKALALDFRAKIKALPVRFPGYPLSSALTLLEFDKHDATVVNARLESEFGFVLNPCAGEQGRSMTRVGHIGRHSLEENDELVQALGVLLG